MFFRSISGDFSAFTAQLKLALPSQLPNEALVLVGLGSTQLVVEMNHRKNNAKVLPQFEEETEQGHRVRASRDGDADAISGSQKFMFPDVGEHALLQFEHGNILQLGLVRLASRIREKPVILSEAENLCNLPVQP
jgi:hypothetical protein